MSNSPRKYDTSPYGGNKWTPRIFKHSEEIGNIWTKCGSDSEWKSLKSVLLHAPGPELDTFRDPDHIQMLSIPDWKLASKQHENLAHAYRDMGVNPIMVAPSSTPPPNLIFCADLFFMTPEGAILARPASTIRAGEERWVYQRLAALGIPILKTLQNDAVFEGADALWLDSRSVLVGRGLRTNDTAIQQIRLILNLMGIETIPVDLPIGTMHLMGILRFLDKDLVITWPYRLAWRAVEALRQRGFKILFVPDDGEASNNGAINFVTLGPREILMPAGNPITQTYLESHGIRCHTVDISELHKAAGGIGCLTGILERDISSKY